MLASTDLSTQYLDGLKNVLDTLDRSEIRAVVADLTKGLSERQTSVCRRKRGQRGDGFTHGVRPWQDRPRQRA